MTFSATGLPGNRLLVTTVPQITTLFWLVKLLTTGGGEVASDAVLLDQPIVVQVAAVLLAGAVFVLALALQLRAHRYVPVRYWFAVLMVAVFGTMVADVAHVIIGIPYPLSTTLFAIVLGVLFWRWHATEHTLSIHDINTPRREWFYWATVTASFAMGTALGDLAADYVPHVFLGSAVVFAVLIVLPGIGWRFLGLDGVLAFWSTYVLTRPLGASVADWLAAPPDREGLDLGKAPVAVVALALIAVLVALMQRRADRGQDAPQVSTASVAADS